jgi:HK97 family phage major capsid protein/HK97 family phage prohead protease
MSTKLNHAGAAHAHELVTAGKVNGGTWDFTAEDGNKLLGANGDDWANYSKSFLATHPDQTPNTKSYYGYPVVKNGEVYRNAVVSAKGRAAQQSATDVENACSSLLDMIDAKKAATVQSKRVEQVQRAYSRLDVKAVTEDDNFYYINGIATTPAPDRYDDVVDPMGAEFALPMPFIWQHDATKPIGSVNTAKASKSGIPVGMTIPKVKEAGVLQDRINEAVQSIKYKLVTGLSIGFRALNNAFEFMENGGILFKQWEWLELSLVTIPANADCSIQTIKSLDTKQRASPGTQAARAVRLTPPAAAGTPPLNSKGTPVKTIQEQITDFEAQRAAKAAQMSALMTKAAEAGTGLEDADSDTYDTLKEEVVALDKHLERLRDHEKTITAKATPVRSVNNDAGAGSGRGPTIIVASRDAEEKFKGQNYTRMVIAKAVAHLERDNNWSPAAIAQHRWGKTNPTLVAIMKANEAPGGGSGSGEWGAELVQADTRYTGDFIEFLYSMTVFDKLPLRQVPANVVIKGQDGQGTGYWVGESKPIPATVGDFSTVSLTPLQVGALAVVSNNLLRDSTPAAEMLVRDMLVQASAQRVDTTFISTLAASAGVSPAGMLNGVSAVNSAGNTGAALRTDLGALYAIFIAAKNASNLQLVMNKGLAKSISLLVNALGQSEFPNITQDGGTLLGDPVVTGDNVGATHFILLKPSDIYRIGDYGIQVSISRDATIEQNTVPTGASDTPVAQTVDQVNMFQSESTAIKVVRPINFAKRRTGAVQYVHDATYNMSST